MHIFYLFFNIFNKFYKIQITTDIFIYLFFIDYVFFVHIFYYKKHEILLYKKYLTFLKKYLTFVIILL